MTRAAERVLYPSDLVRLADAITDAVNGDSVAGWSLNYFKSTYEPVLRPAPGWHLAGMPN